MKKSVRHYQSLVQTYSTFSLTLRLCMLIGFPLTIIGGGYIVGNRYLKQVYTNQNRLLAQLQTTYAQIIHAQQHDAAMRSDVENVYIQLQKKVLQQKNYKHTLIDGIIASLHDANMAFHHYNHGPLIRKPWYIKHELQVDAYGTLEGIHTFLKELQQYPFALSCNSIDVTKQEDTYKLRVALRYATYKKIKPLQLETS